MAGAAPAGVSTRRTAGRRRRGGAARTHARRPRACSTPAGPAAHASSAPWEAWMARGRALPGETRRVGAGGSAYTPVRSHERHPRLPHTSSSAPGAGWTLQVDRSSLIMVRDATTCRAGPTGGGATGRGRVGFLGRGGGGGGRKRKRGRWGPRRCAAPCRTHTLLSTQPAPTPQGDAHRRRRHLGNAAFEGHKGRGVEVVWGAGGLLLGQHQAAQLGQAVAAAASMRRGRAGVRMRGTAAEPVVRACRHARRQLPPRCMSARELHCHARRSAVQRRAHQ